MKQPRAIYSILFKEKPNKQTNFKEKIRIFSWKRDNVVLTELFQVLGDPFV